VFNKINLTYIFYWNYVHNILLFVIIFYFIKNIYLRHFTSAAAPSSAAKSCWFRHDGTWHLMNYCGRGRRGTWMGREGGCWAGVAHTLTHLHQHTHTHTHTTWLAGQQISQRRKPEMKLGPKPQVVVVKMFACTLSNGCLDLLWLLAFSCCS